MAGITHYWEGTTLYITSDSGTTGCDLLGPKGDMGVRGPQGIPGIGSSGISPTITVEETTDGHKITITDVNGVQSFEIKNGSTIGFDVSQYYTKTETDAKIAQAMENLEIPDGTPIAALGTPGKIKPDGVTTFVAPDGTLTATGQVAEIREIYVGDTEPNDPMVLVWLSPNETNYAVAASVDYVDTMVGDFSEALDTINGEVV